MLTQIQRERDFSPKIILALYVMLQRSLKEASKWYPWIQMLPSHFDTPLCYTSEQMQSLKQTQLGMAVTEMQKDMIHWWQNAQPALHAMYTKLGNSISISYEVRV